MRKKTLILFLLFSAFKTMAQQDSLKSDYQRYFFSDSVGMSVFEFAKKNPLLIDALMPPRISRISLGQQRDQGNLVQAQGSTKTNLTSLSTEGSIKLNSLKLYGSFYYQKVFEDSTRFAAQTRNNTSTPYYFGSAANNRYERTIYDFKASALKDLLSSKLAVGLAFDYHVADHFANNDPRGSIKEYQLNTKLVLGYNFTKDFQVSTGLNLGYGTEEVTIGYKRDIYYQSTTYIRYVNHLINGYAAPNPKLSERKYIDNFNRIGYHAALKVTNQPFGNLYVIANQIEEKQRFNYRNVSSIDRLSDYNLTKLDVDILWTKPLGSGRLHTVLHYLNWDGEDYNVQFRAKNYVYTKNSIDVKLGYTLHKNKFIYNYGLNSALFSEEKLDGISGNEVYYQNILVSGNFGLQRNFEKNNSLGFNLGAHYISNVQDQFTVNSLAQDLFTGEVIAHDYLYHTATKFGASAGANYNFPLFKVHTALKLDFVYTDRSGLKTLNRNVISYPGNDRLSSNISLNLYF